MAWYNDYGQPSSTAGADKLISNSLWQGLSPEATKKLYEAAREASTTGVSGRPIMRETLAIPKYTLARRKGEDSVDTSYVENPQGDLVKQVDIGQRWILNSKEPLSILDAETVVSQDANFPKMGRSYSNARRDIICVGIDASHVDGQRGIFNIEAKFSNERWIMVEEAEAPDTDTGGYNGGSGTKKDSYIDPTTLPPVYSSQPVDRRRVVTHDAKTNKPISYSNGRAVSPAIMENFPLLRISVSRNERRFNNSAMRVIGRINSGGMSINNTSFGAETVQLENAGYTTATDTNGRQYYKVVYSFLINPEGFKRSVLQADTHEKREGKILPMPTGNGRAWKLNSDGTFMDAGSQTDPNAGEYLEINTVKRANLGHLRV